jgi:hypothetical protein
MGDEQQQEQPQLWTPDDEPAPEHVRHIHAGDEGSGGDTLQDSGYDLGGGEPQDAGPGDDEEKPRQQMMTMFVVVIDAEGGAAAISNPNDAVLDTMEFAREANFNDMYRACGDLMRDIAAMNITQRTMMAFQSMGAQIAQQQQQADIMAAVQRRGGFNAPGGGPRG